VVETPDLFNSNHFIFAANTYKVSTIVHAIDFSKTNQPQVYEALGQKLQSVQVGVLGT
jgi:hypothetical protein